MGTHTHTHFVDNKFTFPSTPYHILHKVVLNLFYTEVPSLLLATSRTQCLRTVLHSHTSSLFCSLESLPFVSVPGKCVLSPCQNINKDTDLIVHSLNFNQTLFHMLPSITCILKFSVDGLSQSLRKYSDCSYF